ncbi:MAG TPA: 30S ribosomal protein S4 [Bacilli bacterium]|nr:MAG: 30S ribosomal protein S4 [Tenericutes bacterium ADurb.Bin140]HOE77104.1 30S ribosomal protein S4 [Bacilli bacterium]HON64035.1 30S ribosomal protein S4 [Bacilli bacterium]HPK57934.1 30S ribosomal protein S4 [Bacilli bacterium]HPN90743.1 30S ribosomal protein S4 [Bacilli bacterium]
MARYTGPVWKQARRLKFSVLETGKELQRRPFAPGQHGQRRSKLSEYGLQLQEKQKVRFTYGINERQFRNLFEKAGKLPGKQGDNFLFLLESRIDNLVYRLGFATTRRQARQLVSHGHILLDGKKADIPSILVKPGQKISLKEKSRGLSVVKEALEQTVARVPFVEYDENTGVGTFVRYPERSEILTDIRENLIVEFYNR